MVYLLHFTKRISPAHSCQHYIGYANNLANRLDEHRSGNGARLTQVARMRGIDWKLVRVWNGDRKLERKLKKLKCGNRLCPICNPAGAHWCTEDEIVDISAWES